jgi:hypothetical protein
MIAVGRSCVRIVFCNACVSCVFSLTTVVSCSGASSLRLVCVCRTLSFVVASSMMIGHGSAFSCVRDSVGATNDDDDDDDANTDDKIYMLFGSFVSCGNCSESPMRTFCVAVNLSSSLSFSSSSIIKPDDGGVVVNSSCTSAGVFGFGVVSSTDGNTDGVVLVIPATCGDNTALCGTGGGKVSLSPTEEIMIVVVAVSDFVCGGELIGGPRFLTAAVTDKTLRCIICTSCFLVYPRIY